MDSNTDSDALKRLIAIIDDIEPDLSYLGVEQLISDAGLHVETKIRSFSADAVLNTETQKLQKREILEKFGSLTPEEHNWFIGYLKGKTDAFHDKDKLEKLQRSIWGQLTPQERRIYGVILKNPRAQGEEYCKLLRDGGVQPRQKWIRDSRRCPSDYVGAYKIPYWKQQIWEEKKKLFGKIRKALAASKPPQP